MSGNQVIRISPKDKPTGQAGYQDRRQTIWLDSSQCSEYRKSGTPDHPITRSPDHPIPRYPDTPIRYKAGFSLMELMVVVVIIAVMLGVAIPKFISHQNRTSVKLAARDVASVLRLARSKALAKRTYYLGVFNSTPDSNGCCHIWVQEGSSYVSKNPVSGTERSLSKGVVIDTTQTTGGGGGPIYSYVFTSKGTMQVGNVGTIYLRDTGSHTKHSVHMTAATGDIHIKFDSW